MSSPIFNFKLRALDEVTPWTDSNGSNPFLSWFGLTDGNYWMRLNVDEIYRYRPELVSALKFEDVYADYQVARLYEDILGMLPEVLEPVPSDILENLVASFEKQTLWEEKCLEWHNQGGDSDILSEARQWWCQRFLDSMHLASGPKLNIWRQHDTIYFRWNNRGVRINDLLAWTAEFGECSMPVNEFSNQIRDFHDRFMREMANRVETICGGWKRTEIHIDFNRLREEQKEREMSLAQALLRKDATDWKAVRRFNEQILSRKL